MEPLQASYVLPADQARLATPDRAAPSSARPNRLTHAALRQLTKTAESTALSKDLEAREHLGVTESEGPRAGAS